MPTLLAPLRRLRTRLLLIVLMAAVPCALLVVEAGLERRSADGAQAQETARRLAALASLELERLVDGTHNLLVGLSFVPGVRELGPDCSDILRTVHAQSPQYAVVGGIRPDGEYVCSSLPISGPVNLADRRHFRQAVERRGFGVGDFVIGRVSGKASLNLAQAILDDDGNVQAVIIAAIDLDALSSLAARANLPPGSDVTVLDRQGTVLTHYPPGDGYQGSSLAGSDLFRAIQAEGGHGSIDATGADGLRRLYAFDPLLPSEPDGPTVSVGIPTSIAYSSADAALWSNLLKLSIVAACALVAAWLGGEAVVLRRVDTMLAATRRLASGDLTARTGLTRTADDVGELGQAIDDMATALQRRDHQQAEIERTLKESQQRLEVDSERLLTLHRVSANLARETGSLDSVLDDILASAARLTGDCDGATLHLWDAESDTLRRARAWGVPTQYAGTTLLPGVGLAGLVFASGEPIVVDEYQEWSSAMPNARRGQLRAAFGVPLRYGGHRIGVLTIGVHHVERGPFTPDDVRLVGLFADQAAAAIETTRLHDDLARQLGRLRTLSRLNHVIFSTLDRETVLTELARAAAELIQAPLTGIWVVDREAGLVRAGAMAGPRTEGDLVQPDVPIGMSAVGLVAATGEVLEIDDVYHDERLLFSDFTRMHHLRSLVAIPALDDEGQACAVFGLYDDEPLRLTDADRDLMDSLASMAAVAIRNASLYQGEAQARQLAEQASRTKTEFLSRMSHELRTPLNAILGFAQLLEMSKLDPLHAESVDHILLAGKHLLGLIDEVLDISRIEVGRLPLSPEPVFLSEAVPEIVNLVRPLAADRSVSVTITSLAESVVVVDRQRLNQILLNLLTNAIKYNRPGGSVTIICEDDPSALPRITIADTGPGIAPEMMSRLFDPFDRLDAERTGVQGTGLGLAIARALAQAMGGDLDASSVLGVGSEFRLDLPREAPFEQQAEPPVDEEPNEPPAPSEPRYVLCVEDSNQDALLVRRSLAWRPEVTLLSVETGSDGLALARDHPPALILTDLHLPDLSGVEMLARLRDHDRTARIPVVVVTADRDTQQAERLLAAGARAYLTKPFDVRTFLGIVDEILQEAS